MLSEDTDILEFDAVLGIFNFPTLSSKLLSLTRY